MIISWFSNPKCIREECARRRVSDITPVKISWHPPLTRKK